jgi:hypothetical protein
MDIIKQNPFRILGLPANTTERDLQRQIGIIKRYAEIGKTKSFDYDLEILGDIKRDLDDIQLAANRIEQSDNKLVYSLFWFVNNSPIDEIALNYLKQETKKSIEIWKKSLKNEITHKNFSSYQNFSTLALIYSVKNGQVNLRTLRIAIKLKGHLLNSASLKDFSKLVTNNGYGHNSSEISRKFVREIFGLLKPYFNKTYGITPTDVISLFGTYPASIQKYISSMFTEVSTSNIENKIEKTVQKRKDKPKNAEVLGEDLYKSTKSDLTLLKKILGTSSVQYQLISNKLANEILECSIDFFNKNIEEDTGLDLGNYALRVAEFAKSIDPNGQTLDRVNKAIEDIQDWIDETPEREKFKTVKKEVDYINARILHFENVQDSTENVENLLKVCKPELLEIKKRLGKYDDLYIRVSSTVVRNAQNMLVNIVNSAIEGNSKSSNGFVLGVTSPLKTLPLKMLIRKALELTFLFGYFDMDYALKEHYKDNLSAIKSLAQNLHISTLSPEDKIRSEIQNLEGLLSHTKTKQYYSKKLQRLNNEMVEIQQWQIWRSRERKEAEIRIQQQKINELKIIGEREREQDILRIENQIIIKQKELNHLINYIN